MRVRGLGTSAVAELLGVGFGGMRWMIVVEMARGVATETMRKAMTPITVARQRCCDSSYSSDTHKCLSGFLNKKLDAYIPLTHDGSQVSAQHLRQAGLS